MKRGLTARPRTIRASAASSGRARGRLGSVVSSTMRSASRPSEAAAAAKPPTKAASSAPSSRSRDGIVAAVQQEIGGGDPRGEGAGQRRALAVGAAIGMRGGGEIGGADRRRGRCRARAAPRRPRRRRPAPCRRCGSSLRRRCRARAAASGFSLVVLVARGDRLTAASISAICAGNRSRNRPEMRQVTSTRGRPIAAVGSTSMPVTRPVAVVPGRAAAHQREPLRDLLAAGAERGAAPQIDDERARHLAMRLQVEADHLVGGEPPSSIAVGVGRMRGSAVKRLRPVGSTSRRPRCGAPAGPGAHARRRARRAAPRARPRRLPATADRRPPPPCAAIDMQPVLDGEVLEVAEPGIDPAQRLVGIDVARDAGFARESGALRASRR